MTAACLRAMRIQQLRMKRSVRGLRTRERGERVLTSRMKGASALGGAGGREIRRARFVNTVAEGRRPFSFCVLPLVARRYLGFGDDGTARWRPVGLMCICVAG